MAKPVSGALGYDKAADRPTVQLRSGVKRLKTEDDSGGGITSITSTDTSVTITNPSGPVVDLSVAATGDITAVNAGTGLTGGGTSGSVTLAADFGTGAGKVTEGNDSRLSDQRVASALDTTGASVDVTGAAPGTTGQSLTLTDATHATWQSSPALSLYWVDDGSYHADSDDFTEATLNARWTAVNHSALATAITPSGAINATTAPAASTMRFAGGYRGTLAQIQIGDGGIKRKIGAGSRPNTYQIRWRPRGNTSTGNALGVDYLYFAPDNGSGTAPVITTAYLRLSIGNGGASNPCVIVQEFQGGTQSNAVEIPVGPLAVDFELIVIQPTSGTGALVAIRNDGNLHTIPGSHGGSPGLWDIPVSGGGVLWLYQRNLGAGPTVSGGSPVHTQDYIRERRDNVVLL